MTAIDHIQAFSNWLKTSCWNDENCSETTICIYLNVSVDTATSILPCMNLFLLCAISWWANGTSGNSGHEAGGRGISNQVVKILQWGNGMGTGPSVLCHSQSHKSMHSRIKSEMEKCMGLAWIEHIRLCCILSSDFVACYHSYTSMLVCVYSRLSITHEV